MNNERIRAICEDDIDPLLSFMEPFVNSGQLLTRTRDDIQLHLTDYIIYEINGDIRACASLITYPTATAPRQSEIAAVAVDSRVTHLGIGAVLIDVLVCRAAASGMDSVFILTTQADRWFQDLGFVPDTVASLPPARRAKWSPQRASRVYRLAL